MDKEEFFGFNLEEEENVFGAFLVNDTDNDNDAIVSAGCFRSDNNSANQIGRKPKPEEKRAELVTHKAGFDRVDQKKINEILKKLEESSPFGRLKAKKDAELQEYIREQRWIFERLQAQDLTFVRSRVQFCIDRIEQKRDLSKYIVCVDMDAYYASIEERDNPALVSQPMGVGDSAMLCTANYMARKFGVRSGMPGYFAKTLCPQIVIVKPNFEKYTTVSRQIRTIFARYDPNFSAMSLDEAFLDISNYVQNQNSTPEHVVQQIRDEIHSKTKITASAGIAANKLLAKVCADVNKPNGQFRLANDKNEILKFLRDLPVRKICGIGQVAAKILNGAFNIHTCGELLDNLVYINMMFSENSFSFYMRVSLGIGSNRISNNYTRKGMSTSRTFTPTNDVKSLYEYLHHIAEELAQRLDQENLEGKTIAVIFKMQTFEQFTRQKALTRYTSSQHDLYSYSKAILDKEIPISLRLLGIRITNLRDKNATNVVNVNRYFSIKEDDKGTNDQKCFSSVSRIDEVSRLKLIGTLPLISVTNPIQDSNALGSYEMLQLPSKREENSRSESSHNEQSSQQESVYLKSGSQQQSNTFECNKDTGLQKPKRQYTPESQYMERNGISSQQGVFPMVDSSLSCDILADDSGIGNGQSQGRTLLSSILDDITKLSKSSILNDFDPLEHENVIGSKVDSNIKKRALENSKEKDGAKSSTISELLTPKRRLINGLTQFQTQIGNNQECVEYVSATQHLWNCPICDRHFDSPTRMRINSHLEACRAPRFPNTKIGGVRSRDRGRGRGRGRSGSQSSPQPTITLHNFFPSSHIYESII